MNHRSKIVLFFMFCILVAGSAVGIISLHESSIAHGHIFVGPVSICNSNSLQTSGSGSSHDPSSTVTTPSSSTLSNNTIYFTIIEADFGFYKGMNGSTYCLSEAWPIIHVQNGETVIIHVINGNSSEPMVLQYHIILSTESLCVLVSHTL